MAKTIYGTYCKPKLQELLSALKLDQQYVRAKGDYLETDEGTSVLDFVGGFGTTILGHNNPALLEMIYEELNSDLPINVQGAVRPDAALLAERLSNLASSDASYLVNFSNSGAESVEAALKHAYKKHLDKIRREYERVGRLLENFYIQLCDKEDSYEIPNGKSLNKFRDDLDEYNLGQFESFQNNPHIIAFLGSFRGKTSSALKVTFNKSFREPFEGISAIRTHFIGTESPEQIRDITREQTCSFYYPVIRDGKIEVHASRITAVIALIFEIVQGEGGIRPLPQATLCYLADNYDSLALPYIIDEIQTGCGRLGGVFSYRRTPLGSIQPDYITLSKALGGGLCKIGATLIRSDIYDQDFSILHTSTFAEDALSAKIARRCLELLTEDSGALCNRVLATGDYLRQRLAGLKEDYPDLILDIRGEGLLFGIEFSELSGCSPFFRSSAKQGVLSLLISSYLLNYHQMRVLVPLTTMLKGNPGKKRLSIIRIQPSAYIRKAEIDQLIAAFREVLTIIRCNNEFALVYHLIGEPVPETDRINCRSIEVKWPVFSRTCRIDSRTAFVAHPASIDNLVEYYFPSFKEYPYDPDAVASWWNSISRFLEPVHCRSEYIESGGFVIEMNIVMVPFLPEYFNPRHKPHYLVQEMRDKIQDAVTIAKELGDENIPVTMVGLGAYTSIITKNGMTINDFEVPVTSGNAYTTALTIQGIFRACEEQGLDIAKAKIAIVGASGNIGSVLSRILSLYAGELLLIGSATESSLDRLRSTRHACYVEIAKTAASTAPKNLKGLCAGIMQRLEQLESITWDAGHPDPLLDNSQNRRAQLQQAIETTIESNGDTGQPISISTDIGLIKDHDVVVVATNSPDPNLIRPDMVKKGAIICCASIPSNISPQFDDLQTDYYTFDSGLARLPGDSEINFIGMPKNHLAYGCLSETLLLGFEGLNHSFSKGRLATDQIYRVLELAREYGFDLGELTLHHHKLGRTVPA